MRKRIRNILREAVVQGDLFADKFGKEDERIMSLQYEIERKRVMIARLEDEVRDWESREYKPNTRPIMDTNKQIVSIGQVNDRRKNSVVGGKRQQIQRLKDEIVQLEAEM